MMYIRSEIIRVFNVVFVVFLCTAQCFAAPSTPVVSGDVGFGNSITITGSSFGSHTLQIESLQNNIEASTVGSDFAKIGWHLEDWYLYGPVPKYANDSAHSGVKSIKCDMSASNGDCTYAFDMPDVAAGQRFYATWWVKFDGAANGQWKMFRSSYGLTIIDNIGQLNMFNWFDLQQQNSMHPGTAYERVLWYSGLYPTADNTWHRVEADYQAASSNGASDGVIRVRVTKENGTITEAVSTNVNTHPTGLPWRYVVFQNYLGNEHTVGTEIWTDDNYIQTGTIARVELCAGSTWSNRGRCEIQVPSAWTDTSISATVNTGSFAEGSTAYLYVIDSNGDASPASSAITIGSSGGSTITCYQDADNDLYGHGVSESVESCSTGYYIASHFTSLTGDCNDTSSAIHPGATDTCGNGIDEDCSGSDASCNRVLTTAGGGVLTTSSGNWLQ